MIPIYLIITLEIIKLIQGVFMRKDSYSYSKIRKKWLIFLNKFKSKFNFILINKELSPNSISLMENVA